MRHLILFCFALLLALPSYSQDVCDNKVKSVCITDNDEYVVPYNEKDATWTKTLNQDMIDKIWDLYYDGTSIKQVEVQDDGDFVMLWGRNQAKWKNIPDDLADKILELNSDGKLIKNVCLRDDDEFVILYDRNDAMWTTGIPQNLIDKILELNEDGKDIQQVVMTDNDDYIIRWGKNEASWTRTIPKALSDKILELYNNDSKVEFIELTDDNEFVIVWDENHSYYSEGIPEGLKKKLRELSCFQSDDKSIDKPTITWNYPDKSTIYVTDKYQTLKACIKSDGDVDEVKVYVNGDLYNSDRDFVIKKNDACAVDFKKSVYLKEGENNVKIVATNAGGTTTSYSRTIKVKKKEIVVVDEKKDDRIALIIGNANYRDVNAKLKNPVNDADDMEKKLKTLGFEVLKLTDATQIDMKKKIREFGKKLDGNKVALFYYAGHGFQIDGKNYLVPIDATIEDQADAEDACVSVDFLLTKMEISTTQTNLVVLDACRNNPFRSWRSSSSGGLSSLKKQPIGSVIAFATQPGNVAADGTGRNGLYTSAWLKHLKSGSNIFEVLTNVNQEVTKNSSEKQVPWFNSSLQGIFTF